MDRQGFSLTLALLCAAACTSGAAPTPEGCDSGGGCDAGFVCDPASGLCIAAADACAGIGCSGHGTCVASGSQTSCDCEPGYLPSGVDCAAVSDSSYDADAFLWGTEGNVNTDDALDLLTETEAVRDAINGTLQTKFVKLRFTTASFTTTDGGTTYSSGYCLPDPTHCAASFDMDEVAALYQANGWSMVPMIRQDESQEVTTALIDAYVDFVDWFLGRYKTTASIQMIELVNSPLPGSTWRGTSAQLVELTNKTYERVKSKYPDVAVGTPGFEYWADSTSASDAQYIALVEHFLDPGNGANFDFWAFHGYHLAARSGGTTLGPYPPTTTPTLNVYAGIPGILRIRQALDANGWEDRPIVDTEHGIVLHPGETLTPENDALAAAYAVQELLLKRTLQDEGVRALSGALPLKIAPRGTSGEPGLCSLNGDGSVTAHVRATALLWSKLKQYPHLGHVSGAFDDETQPWVERFGSASAEMFVFFKPFHFVSGQRVALDGETLEFSLTLGQVPASVTLTDVQGTESSLPATQVVTLSAENSPMYLEVTY